MINAFPIKQIKAHNLGAPILERHFTSPFKVLIACLISLRTKDEVSDVAAERLFARALTPNAMLKLSADEIAKLIYPAGFYKTKAENMLQICRSLLDKYQGSVPSTLEELLALKGVGLKTANLVLAQGFKIPAICVDTHVHRVMNRLGYINTAAPDETEAALRKKLPKKYWLEINSLLVNFGREICQPVSPWCSRCKLAHQCPRKGIVKHR